MSCKSFPRSRGCKNASLMAKAVIACLVVELTIECRYGLGATQFPFAPRGAGWPLLANESWSRISGFFSHARAGMARPTACPNNTQ